MSVQSALSALSICVLASFGVAACSANTDEAPQEPAGEVQDQEIKKSISACSVDSDCVSVPRGGCCNNGFLEAVNKNHTADYANATKCTANPRPMCPLFLVHDTRVAKCDSSAKQCKMVALDASLIQGHWGANAAIMTITAGKGSIEFGCASASIDAFTFSDASTFTATGTHTAGTGVQFPPGMGPHPQAATFKGHLVGNTLTLEMDVAGNASSMTFTKDRQINLMRCL